MATASTYLYKAMQMARQAGRNAHLYRRRSTQQTHATQQLHDWSRIFDSSFVLIVGLTFFGLAFVDCYLMMPMYEQVSELVTAGDPHSINWEIAIAMIGLAAVCSTLLTQTYDSGPFYRWAILLAQPEELSALEMDQAHSTARIHFSLVFLCYCAILALLVWIRSGLISESGLDIQKVEIQMSGVGIIVSLGTVLCGTYLAPLIDYLAMNIRIFRLDIQKNRLLSKVTKADHFIYLVWARYGDGIPMPLEVYHALTRHKSRHADDSYCNDVMLPEA